MTATGVSAEALFFELSHPKRLAILRSLRVDALHLSAIAELIQVPPPEASRHLRRLAELGLLVRGSDGALSLTPFGRLVIAETSSFEFLARHQAFLRSHDLTMLPAPFVRRLAELSESENGTNVSHTLRHVEGVLNDARQFAWFISDQPILTEAHVRDASRKSLISVRAILPRSNLETPRRREIRTPPDGAVEIRSLPDVRIGLAMNELVAGVCFASPAGGIDYSAGFRGVSPVFRTWCRELFEHFWRLGTPVKI